MGPKTDTKSEQRLAELQDEITDLSDDLRQSNTIGKTLATDPSKINLFKARLTRIDGTYHKYLDRVIEAIRLSKILENTKLATDLAVNRNDIRDLYYETLSFDISESDTSNTTLNTSNAGADPVSRIKLPTIPVPSFNGDLSSWASFKDTYESLIHNNEHLGGVQKFHYLKSALKGTAAQTISAIPITSKDYIQAWNALVSRYDNKRLQATNYLTKIFNFKPLPKMGFPQLQQFSEIVLESASAFNRLNLPDPSGFILFTFALRLLDSKTREKFENAQLGKTEVPTYDEFVTFIHQQSTLLQSESITASGSTPAKASGTVNRGVKQILMSTHNSTLDLKNCPICHIRHKLYRCSTFLSLNPKQRYERIKVLHLCTNCLSPNHSAKTCKSATLCRFCQKNHHSLLHFPTPKHNSSLSRPDTTKVDVSLQAGNNVNCSASSTKTSIDSNNPGGCPKGTVLAASETGKICVLLGTAMARIQSRDGHYHPVRILIDSGSQRSFLTTTMARKLGLRMVSNPQPMRGFSDAPIQGGKHQAECTIVPADEFIPALKTSAVIVSHITEKMPLWPLPNVVKEYLSDYKLADPLYWKPGPIDFLLGADLFGDAFTGECISTPDGFPSALKTIFGCVLIGPMQSDKFTDDSAVALITTGETANPSSLDNLIQRFWEVETVGNSPASDPEDIQSEEFFLSTHTRDSTGRYTVRLPFKSSKPDEFQDSYATALSRFRKLEYRLDKTPDLKQEYSRVIQNYVDAGYISSSKEKGKYYLPHHCVVKDSSSTKIRIVFDASCPSHQGSLNDHLRTGPKLQLDIKDVILDFRRFFYVIAADIYQMYLQILVHPDDRDYQHFLFRPDSTEPVIDYQLNRVSFGMSCSPYLAIRVLHQLIQDEGSSCPDAATALKENIYVDDILTGADSLPAALTLQNQLIQLLGKGGFLLKKWSSNCKALLEQVPHDQQENPLCFSCPDSNGVKILGLKWDPSEDCLSYNIQTICLVMTKRGVMSTIARMYDPLGYLAPVVFKAKTILQSLWSLKLGWDEELPFALSDTWSKFFHDLPSLAAVRIPRCLFSVKPSEITIVGFADASTCGYAAVIYLRNQSSSGFAQTHLVISKTRLAPLKTVSIPRLELCAALLLVQTLKSISCFLKHLNINGLYLFSDSTIVLSWLKLSPHTLKTFVANRVTAILEETEVSNWHHISSSDNPADIASRGLAPTALINNNLWWNGPRWLVDDISCWPLPEPSPLALLPEMKSASITLTNRATPTTFLDLIGKFSSFSKLVRVVAYVKRFISNLKMGRLSKSSGPLTLAERRAATTILIKCTQQFYFSSDLPLDDPKKCSFISLAPYLDTSGIIRVGGRLAHSPLPENAKHPIILPTKAHLTQILIDFYHVSYLHAGPQLLHSLIQRQYWIISARRVIRSRVHQCVTCHRFKAKSFTPYMADLPPTRFEQGRAFLNTGVDFAGPFIIKESNRKKAIQHKAYVCLFVCLSTKAVHLEVVSQLTTDAFLACLDRFIARRGLPSKILSDHGSNFIGASRHLNTLYQWLSETTTQKIVSNHLSDRQIKWEFIPPVAPHFGGIWEAGVKSFKSHLVRVLNGHVLTFEELSTLTTRIEAVLNSRPLYPLSNAPEEFDTLTPGHFLIGGPAVALPEYNFTETPINRLSRWQLLNQCVQNIWRRWRRDYLNSLQQRVKWKHHSATLDKNNLVLLKDDTIHPLDWPTGRILETYPGPDGIVRVVKLRTPKGEYMRPASRLAPLLPQ